MAIYLLLEVDNKWFGDTICSYKNMYLMNKSNSYQDHQWYVYTHERTDKHKIRYQHSQQGWSHFQHNLKVGWMNMMHVSWQDNRNSTGRHAQDVDVTTIEWKAAAVKHSSGIILHVEGEMVPPQGDAAEGKVSICHINVFTTIGTDIHEILPFNYTSSQTIRSSSSKVYRVSSKIIATFG